MMKILNVVTLPVVNVKNKLEGIIVTGDITKSYMDVYDNAILSRARTQYRNIAETLEGTIVTGNEHGYFIKGIVRGKEVRIAVTPPDKGGFTVLDIVFGNSTLATFVPSKAESPIVFTASGKIMLFNPE